MKQSIKRRRPKRLTEIHHLTQHERVILGRAIKLGINKRTNREIIKEYQRRFPKS